MNTKHRDCKIKAQVMRKNGNLKYSIYYYLFHSLILRQNICTAKYVYLQGHQIPRKRHQRVKYGRKG